jgi:hypothetical protein
MSLEESNGPREIFPVIIFPPGSMNDYALDARPERVTEEEAQGKAAPKDSSAPASVSSSNPPVAPEQQQTVPPLSGPQAPPAPPSPIVTADKGSGQLKENESSTPTG